MSLPGHTTPDVVRNMFNPKPPEDPKYRIPRQCIWLKLNGSWPTHYEPTNDFYTYRNLWCILYRSWSWYVIISVGITIGFQTAFLIRNFGNIIMTTENCCTTFMGALNFVRLLHLRLNQKQFRHIIEKFVNDIWIVKWVLWDGGREHHRTKYTLFKETYEMFIVCMCIFNIHKYHNYVFKGNITICI